MAKKPVPIAVQGAPDAISVYILVGTALSYWEAAEDAALDLFRHLCGDVEPIAMESYVQAPRKVRTSMLDLALDVYRHRLTPEEIARTRAAQTRLNKLAEIRNQIAHGYVQQLHATEGASINGDGRVIASGVYLLPGAIDGRGFQRNPRFHHTDQTIAQFEKDVRHHRWELIEVLVACKTREQADEMAADPESYAQQQMARKIVTREIRPQSWSQVMRPMNDWPLT